MKLGYKDSEGYIQVAREFLLGIARRVQAERTYSTVSPEVLEETMYEATKNGCLTVQVLNDEGTEILGLGVIVRGDDIHVGDLYYYEWMYIPPQHRKTAVIRQLVKALVQVTRASDLHWCGYTYEQSPCVFVTRYKKVD